MLLLGQVGFLGEVEGARLAGAVVWPILMVAGALKCWSVARRGTHNAKAVLALMVTLLAMAASSVLGAYTKMNPGTPRVVSILVLFAVVVALVVAGVLAVIGLVELRSSRRSGEVRYGKRQAGWALVLGCVMWLVIGWGAYTGLTRGARAESFASGERVAAGEELWFDETNFRYSAPGRPWVKADAKRIHQDVTLAFVRGGPEMTFTITAERIPGVEITSEQYADHVLDQCRSMTDSVEVVSRRASTLCGIEGTELRNRFKSGTTEVSQVHWTGVRGDYAYHLMVFSRVADEGALLRAAPDMFGRFGLVKANPPPVSAVAARFHSDRWGYTVLLDGAGWKQWAAVGKQLPEAEFGVLNGGDTCFAVLPLSLEGLGADTEAVAAGLARRFECDLERATAVKRFGVAPSDGVSFECARTMDDTVYHYAARVVRRGDVAYMAVGWTADPEKKMGQVRATVDSLVIDAAPARVPAAVGEGAPSEAKAASSLLNHTGLVYYNRREFERSIPFFVRAAALNPREPLYVMNHVQALAFLRRFDEQRRVLEEAVGRFPGDLSLRRNQGYAAAETGDKEGAAAIYREVFAGDYVHDDGFGYYVNLLSGMGRVDEAIAEIGRYVKRSRSVDLVVRRAELLSERGRNEEAVSFLKEWRGTYPANTALAYALAERYQDAREYAKTLEVVAELAGAGQDTAYAKQLRGRAELGMKRYREAKASLEASAAQDPDDRATRRYLAHVSGILGQGDNSGIRVPVEAVGLPAGVSSTPVEPGALPEAGCMAYYLRRATAIAYEPGVEYRTTVYRTVKVVDRRGAEEFNDFQFAFDPLAERIYLNRLEVRGADGRVRATGSVEDCFVTDEAGRATRRKVLNVPVPAVQPGCVIELVVSRCDLAPDDAFPFFEQALAAGLPVLQGGVYVRVAPSAAGRVRASGVNGAGSVGGGEGWIHWGVGGPIASVPSGEPDLPEYQSFLPTVYVGDARASWEGVGREYSASVADLLAATDERVTAAARAAAGDLTSDREKALALARYVRDHVAYKAIEFGRHARIPAAAAVTLEKRYGDCKDQSLLLHQLLRAVGVKSRLVLMRTYGEVVEGLPSLDQFNHMIVHVPAVGDGSAGLFLDCTNKDAAAADTVGPGYEGRRVLVLGDEGGAAALVALPARPEGVDRVTSRRTVRVLAGGDVSVRETVTCEGARGAGLRGFLKARDAAERSRAIRATLDPRGDAIELDGEPRVLNEDSPEEPLVLELAYTLRGRFRGADGRLAGILPAAWEHMYLMPDASPERRAPFRVSSALEVMTEATVEAPQGYAVAFGGPGEAVDVDDRFVSARVERVAGGDGRWAALRSRVVVRPGTFAAAERAGFERARREVVGALEPEVVVSASAGGGQ